MSVRGEPVRLEGAPVPGLQLAPGQAFPDLVLPTTDRGERLSVGNFRGRNLLLHFFASW